MHRLMILAGAAILFASPAFATGDTGIGKGGPTGSGMQGGHGTPTPGMSAAPPPPPPNPCKSGDTYYPAKNLCLAKDGSAYTPGSP
jgi:hypothetical protein